MESRREFIQKAALLASSAGWMSVFPSAIQKALAINPPEGSTYLDAEHVVILMQENRSFDHCFGSLQGVRGFNDPRAISLPNQNKVWLQTNATGQTFVPFRLNLKDSKATWMSSLPHSWDDQVDARNNGKYDKWLDSKKSGHAEYKHMPLTLGYYNRDDLPFYYALADAFTVCDQNFCSSLTGTTPNRLYLWSGTIREQASIQSKANVFNSDIDYESWARWKSFPERLEEQQISWKIYQNEINLSTGFTDDEDRWLGSFSDNPIEWFERYNIKLAKGYYPYIQKQIQQLPTEIAALKQQLADTSPNTKESEKLKRELQNKENNLQAFEKDARKWRPEVFDNLSEFEKNIHRKAFTTNRNDPHYRELTTLTYDDNGTQRQMTVPKGDVLHQFRADVEQGQLPTVSWLVAPENFSDHPGAPWYGAWYLSEVLEILTKNPDVWKKTIFILAYDENDGYFDHVPPFIAPDPQHPHAGKVSAQIDASVEHVTLDQEKNRKRPNAEKQARSGSIGLGYRVPLLIASPWSRGGRVCSQVFDHTSVLQFLEKFLTHKTGKPIQEPNISQWRRAVCGDLTSVFRPYRQEKIKLPTFVQKDEFIETVHKAQFKQLPTNFKALTGAEIEQINQSPNASPLMPKQEPGIREACALPYELYVEGGLSATKQQISLSFKVDNAIFGQQASGAPFVVYAPKGYAQRDAQGKLLGYETARSWNYALTPGDQLSDGWPIENFENQEYFLRVYGPNGFFRELLGNAQDPALVAACHYERSQTNSKQWSGNVELHFKNNENQALTIELTDLAYGQGKITKTLAAKGDLKLTLDLSKSFGWYDFSVMVKGNMTFAKRYAGHVETGRSSFTDPLMGKVAV
ncbi:MAG: phospholipase C, phosphocholine-specific [Spirosomataceae bacterium]